MPRLLTTTFPATRLNRLIIPLALLLLFLLRYLSTLTHVHTFDALSYVLDVDRKPLRELFHPHHLAYGPLGSVSLGVARALGYTGSAALPLQVVNAVAGALGVALFFVLIQRLLGRSDVALVAALLLGSSYAYWYYSVEVEVYTVAVLFLVICLHLFVQLLRRPTTAVWIALGVAQTLAILFHQTNVLLCAPALVICALNRSSQARRVRWLLAYLTTLAVGVGLSYGLVGIVSGFGSWAQFSWWLTSYARTGWWGGPITGTKWASLGQGLADTLAQPGGALLAFLLVGLGVVYGRAVVPRHWRLACCLVCWLLVYGAFFLWWEPDNIEFWIASLPPALLLLSLALSDVRHWGVGVSVGLVVALTLLAVNGDSITWRGTVANDLQRRITTALAAKSTPADFLLVPDGMQELYLPYYEGRDNYLSLNQAIFNNRGDVADGVPLSEASNQPYWPETCATIQARIENTLAAGDAVVIGSEVLHPPGLLLQRHGLSQAQIDTCFEQYRTYWVDIGLAAPLPTYMRLPTAQELADGSGWNFTNASWGWKAINITSARFDGSWRLTPGNDPQIISPLLHLDTSRFQAIELRIAHTTRARDAQLFFGDEHGLMQDTRSVHLKLKRSHSPQTYRIDLRGQPGWTGIVTRLRLDPVGTGDGGGVRLESIRLVP